VRKLRRNKNYFHGAALPWQATFGVDLEARERDIIPRYGRILMKRVSTVVLCLFNCIAFAQNPTIPASEAAKHLGEQGTVCGLIASKHTVENSKGKPTFVDLDHSFPSQTFTVVIWESDKAKVGDFPASGSVCVTGAITAYKGVPQIVLHDAKSWSVVPKAAAQ
jgi:hypothetical protein